MAVSLHQLLKTMLEMGGSDLHVTNNSPPQVRVDGKLRPLDMPPLSSVETKQIAYNKEHGITPLTIQKKVTDIMQGAYNDTSRRGRRYARVAEAGGKYANVTVETLGKAVEELEKKMFKHAELLEFEEAAGVRDQILKLKDRVLM